MSFALRPFLQDFPSNRGLILAEGCGLGVQPDINGLSNAEAEVLQRKAHAAATAESCFEAPFAYKVASTFNAPSVSDSSLYALPSGTTSPHFATAARLISSARATAAWVLK